ncbi:glutamine--tRNA ligase isoform X2 [Prunus yedoensis var. nudiflora]|uniref:Glutaminyl-tRNA synthetase n=1 Tax=Prunus yedoensis var. nudiflora TaxID=2094558 RepID=A0A314YHC7_PRUYE|nr:glutamine--tRNA ligase isoform X2 [Prunus yedoensis var. nudiflora]
MALALTEFEALCGFISVKELKDMLSSVPEIAELVGVGDAERILLVNEQHENGKSKTDLESIFSRVMLLSKDTISEMISKLKRRLNLEKKKRQLTVKEQLALRLESQYPADVGAIAAFFLNYVKLNRGEAISLGPNEPHAYISGECIECMATSDNVVRAGLTSKPLDVQTLLSMLKYRQGSPEILQGVSLNPYTTRYLPPFEEFEVDCCNLPQSAAVIFPSVLGPSLFLFTAGKGHFDAGLTEDDMVKEGDDIVEEGEVFFVPANTKISITAKSTELQLYRLCQLPAHTYSEDPDRSFPVLKMPGKDDGGSDKEKNLELFLKVGLDERTAKNTIANNKVTANLTAVIHEAAVTDGCSRTVGNLLYTVATKHPANALVHRPTLVQYIVSSKVGQNSSPVRSGVFIFCNYGPENFKLSEFEEACGVGVEVSEEEIKQTVNEVFEENKTAILEQRYRTNVGDLFAHVRKRHPWADPKIVKQFIDAKLRELLGERTAADDEKVPKKKKEKPAKVEEKAIAVSTPEQPSEEVLNPFLIFPQPEENTKVHTSVFFSDGSILRCCNTKELLEKHLSVTGGKVLTRFPPEPNGYLHIGHAKAMFIDFGLAKERGGGCYLRFDDTNPEAEKKEYIDHIQEIVKWMGWEPYKITYTSDYFQDLYDLAVELIRRGHAYVDHQTPDEIKEYREKKMNSPWRDRPIAESLKLFEDMRRGLIEEGKATLRMKQDMQSDNFNMYDLIAYRIKFTPHPHAGDKWCIYPSYDYAHCIVDSLENITHSLCTLEFETRRASYYWLLHALGIYQPYVWEYSRLNISNTVMSKRKLNRLVTEKWVDGWDDPRLMTLAGLRRRGVTSTAINAFVRGIGITRSDCSMIHLSRLEYHIREELNKTAPRSIAVLHPLKVVITNLEAKTTTDLEARKWPDAQTDDASAFYKVPFSNTVYIERSDFRLKDSKDYFGLAPGKSVLLRYAFPIKCTDVILADDKETVLEIRAEYDPTKKTKPKGVLHWVAEPSPGVDPLKVEIRLFDRLFLSENPAELDDWLAI